MWIERTAASLGAEPFHRVTVVARFMLAWVVFGLLLLGLSGLHAAETLQVTGQVSATDQEADEGYFAVGQETTVIAKPGSDMHNWLRSHLGQRVTVSVGREEATR